MVDPLVQSGSACGAGAVPEGPVAQGQGAAEPGLSLAGLDLVPLCVTFLLCFWEVQYGRHRGRGAGLRDSSALLHCQASNKGGLHTSPWMQQGQPGSPGSWELGGDSPRASGFGVRGDSLPPPSSPVSPACRRRSTGTPFKDHEERSIPGAESRRGRHCCPCSC